jgi:hypothetical protein
MAHRWEPRCDRPEGLVAPVAVDAAGIEGPTPNQARGPRWRQTSRGLFVPSTVHSSVVEQRILEQGARAGQQGAVTAWASLRWQGGTFFDGTCDGGRGTLPVPLVIPTRRRADPRVSTTTLRLEPTERFVIDGLACTTIQRALFDEVCRLSDVREAANAIAMAAAAQLISCWLFTLYLAQRTSWNGIIHARRAAALARDDCRSPQEFRMLMVWLLDAMLPEPLCNREVYDLEGRLIGVPDLLDVEAGLAGEYQGEDHKGGARHRRDVEREAKFRDHGLELFEVVGGDLAHRQLVVERMLNARRRAKFLPPESRAWTLQPPSSRPLPETLDAYLVRIGQAAHLFQI